MDDYHNQLLKELPSCGEWYHKIDFGTGISLSTTKQARNPEEMWKNWIEPYLPSDLSGKSVLDLGCNSGYLSMKMKKKGASKVVSVDYNDKFIKQTKFVSKWFNVDLEIIHQEAHEFVLTTDYQFDYIIFVGLFYHLKYGVMVLDRLAEMTKEKLFFQSATVGPLFDDIPKRDFMMENGDEMVSSSEVPKLIFIENKFRYSKDNWWIPNQPAMIALIRNAGLKIYAKSGLNTFVCEPENTFSKKLFDTCVFPQHGKLSDKSGPGFSNPNC